SRGATARDERRSGRRAERGASILHLATVRFTAKLAHRFNEQKDAASARMVRRKSASVGIGRKTAAFQSHLPGRRELAPFTDFAESRALKIDDDVDGESVIHHCGVDIAWPDARHRISVVGGAFDHQTTFLSPIGMTGTMSHRRLAEAANP